jgi:hypothetical protein
MPVPFRFFTACSSGEDHHGKIAERLKKTLTSDQPITVLLSELKARGLLDDRLVLWGGESGRTPHTQQNEGPGQTPRREQNHRSISMWMSGSVVKCTITDGVTADFGYDVIENQIHMNDLHATMCT